MVDEAAEAAAEAEARQRKKEKKAEKKAKREAKAERDMVCACPRAVFGELGSLAWCPLLPRVARRVCAS